MLCYFIILSVIGFGFNLSPSSVPPPPPAVSTLPNSSIENVEHIEISTTTSPPIPVNPTIIYITIGVCVTVLLLMQLICVFVIIKKVKITPRRLESIIRSTAPRDVAVRYSATPMSMKTQKDIKNETDVYESLTDLNKPGTSSVPPPPPISTLPKIRHPEIFLKQSFQTISTMPSRSWNSQAQSMRANGFQNNLSVPRIRDRLPTPPQMGSDNFSNMIGMHKQRLPIPPEMMRDTNEIQSNSLKWKSRMPLPLPNETQPVIQIPPPARPRPPPSRKPVPPPPAPSFQAVPIERDIQSELMTKLKRREQLNQLPAGRTGSLSPLLQVKQDIRPKIKAVLPIPSKPKPTCKENKDDLSDDSEEEWTMEHLKQINMYNI